MKKPLDVLISNNKVRALSFLGDIRGKKPLFICTIATTETAKIKGISAAGENPEITDFTPPADSELLLLGKCKCIPGVPITPGGIPTPALITMSALQLADIPVVVASGGVRIKPHIPLLELGGIPGKDISTGKAVENVDEVIQRAKIAGANFAKTTDYLVIGESIPGGTTTALGVLLSMGINAEGKVSSSLPQNPHKLKIDTVNAGLSAKGECFGSLAKDPINAISFFGDPMMPVFVGMVLGAAERVPVLMGGGTQMSSVLAILKALNPKILSNVAIGTTRWITDDPTSDLAGIVAQISDVPILAADINFSNSRFDGLKAYERGIVKEGVGAGGAAIAAMAKTEGEITKDILLKEIEKNYESLMGMK